jgi:Uma2 family endonuclease
MEICKRVQQLLETVLHRSRVWVETGYRFPDGSWLQPDGSVIWPDQRIQDDYFVGAPMLAVEVGSRGQTAEQLDRKIGHYFTGGAGEVWVIQQKTASMSVYSRRPGTGEITSIRITGTYECPMLTR